jgi:hypothetical protein
MLQTFKTTFRQQITLTIFNKLLIYTTIIKPIWTYGLKIWGSAKPSNIKCIHSFQSKVLQTIVSTPFYVPNRVLHKDLNVPLVADLASTRYKSFHSSFHLHECPLVQALSSLTLPQNPPRRLNMNWPRDFLRVVPVGDFLIRSPDICCLFLYILLVAYYCRWQNKNKMLKKQTK